MIQDWNWIAFFLREWDRMGMKIHSCVTPVMYIRATKQRKTFWVQNSKYTVITSNIAVHESWATCSSSTPRYYSSRRSALTSPRGRICLQSVEMSSRSEIRMCEKHTSKTCSPVLENLRAVFSAASAKRNVTADNTLLHCNSGQHRCPKSRVWGKIFII